MIERTCKPAHARGKKSLLAALIAACMAVAPATAGTIGISGTTLVIGAEPSDSGVTLTAATDLTHFSLFDPGGTFDLVTSGCDQGLMFFSCELSGFSSIVVIGSAAGDLFEFSGVVSIGATFAGGDGNDHIIGTSLADVIYGGAGDDLLFGSAATEFFGGPGDNSVFIVGSLGQLEPGTDLGNGNPPPLEPLPRPPLAVPEPSSMLLLLAGLGATVLTNFRAKRRALRYC